MDREVIKAVSRLSSIEWDHHLFSMNCDVIHLNEVPLLKIMDTLRKREAIAYVCFNEAMPSTPNTLTASEANKKLMESARDARGNSYCPYSKNKVGAALLTVDGEIITGCSIENHALSLKTCALQVAFIKAVSSKEIRIYRSRNMCRDGGRFPPNLWFVQEVFT